MDCYLKELVERGKVRALERHLEKSLKDVKVKFTSIASRLASLRITDSQSRIVGDYFITDFACNKNPEFYVLPRSRSNRVIKEEEVAKHYFDFMAIIFDDYTYAFDDYYNENSIDNN